MKRIISVLMTLLICVSIPNLVHAEREYIGTNELKDNMLFINNNSIPAIQLPNGFVYLLVEDLSSYGFTVERTEENGDIRYYVKRNEQGSFEPLTKTTETREIYTTEAEVYLDSDLPANAFELENGAVLIQCDELAKYGSFFWDSEAHTISIDLEDSGYLPGGTDFQIALGVADMDDIAYGTIVFPYENRCADIEAEDLRNWLNVYWNFYCDRVVAPMTGFGESEYYIKLWNKDKTKSYTVYEQGVMVGSFGAPYESHGETKKNYVWYMPYVGNARNALYTADTTLYMKYLNKTYEEYIGKEREVAPQDRNDIPVENVLVTTGCSEWAEPEIQKAAAANLLPYNLTDKYTHDITRLAFCELACRLIVTEFSPESDSRLGSFFAIESIVDEKGLREKYVAAKFTDCYATEVNFLSAAGIIQGMGDGTFAPDSTITREQAATILYRMVEFLGNKTMAAPQDTAYFRDEAEISDWAADAVKSIYEMGIMTGVSDRDFSPQGAYTVEQAIATMLRLYEKS